MAPILKMISDCQSIVEELDGAHLHAVLRPNDQQAVPFNPPLEQCRAMSQVIDGRANVGACGFRDERRGIVRHGRGEQRLDRRPDAIDDGAQIGRLVALRLAQLLQRRGYSTALRVSHDDGATILPATRMTNRSPKPWPKMSSAGTRESEQPSTMANGCCPAPGRPPDAAQPQ